MKQNSFTCDEGEKVKTSHAIKKIQSFAKKRTKTIVKKEKIINKEDDHKKQQKIVCKT